ncbi:MAG: DNA-directed RNA polymerase subunit alpha [Patescibacteria group bacterium]|jgi:DNA-directed RNA polymerase subunit alpha|nr:DNA-directed RNA polymerase subunit alpha [Patescibacteria group bacterium]
MLSVSLPKSLKYEESGKNSGIFTIEGCYPGYGTTLGNSIRRVLLSSLSGSAVTMIKVKGATHEFTTVKGVKEDVVQLVLNLKQVRFKLHEEESVTVFLKAKGEKEVTAKDIKTTSDIEVANTDQYIATLTSASSDLEIEIKIEKGIGYVPVEQQFREEKEIGSIAVDAIYSPIVRVNFSVGNMRVGKRTDYDKITLEVETDGTMTPQEAYNEAVEILMAQFNAISEINKEEKSKDEEEKISKDEEKEIEIKKEEKEEEKEEEETGEDVEISTLKISTRIQNILEENGIKTVGDVVKLSEHEINELEGMGEKGIKEIKKAISKFGAVLKPSKE